MKAKAQQLLEVVSSAHETKKALDTLRDRYVMPQGSLDAPVALVGAGPNEGDEQLAVALSGPTGAMLDKAIKATGIACPVYKTVAVKFRPQIKAADGRIHQTGDRQPSGAELAAFKLTVQRELEIVQPKIVVALGSGAMQALTGNPTPITSLRGLTLEYRSDELAVPLVATEHPSSALRGNGDQDPCYWRLVEDLTRVFQFATREDA